MPATVSCAYNNTGSTVRYFPLGPLPPRAFLQYIHGFAVASGIQTLNLAHVLTIADHADAAAHAAGMRLLRRSSFAVNGKPAYQVGLATTVMSNWAFPIMVNCGGGGSWILTAAAFGGALETWTLCLTAEYIMPDEYQHLYGVEQPVLIVGERVKPATGLAAPAPAAPVIPT